MAYRIELEKIDRRYKAYDKNDFVDNVTELKTYLKECVESGYKVARIIKTIKDGRGYDVTNKYIK